MSVPLCPLLLAVNDYCEVWLSTQEVEEHEVLDSDSDSDIIVCRCFTYISSLFHSGKMASMMHLDTFA